MTLFPLSWWQRFRQRKRWQSGHASETGFWDRYLKTRGLRWPQEFSDRMDPDSELSRELSDLIGDTSPAPMRILDVGAGPLTVVGKCFRGTHISLTAVDPLAQHYDQLLKKHGLIPPVRTIFGKAENVATQFQQASFDLVHARNCLDHGIDPFHAVSQMLTLAKPGGFVYLKHHPNEGLNEQWHGLHQWNFSMSGSGDFIISSRDREVNVTSEFADRADVHCEMRTEAGEEWLIVQIHKQ
jgi:SAM-dependent methyltransferase